MSAIAFALLQSVCALFVGLAGLQTVIGISALTAAVLRYVIPFHTDWVRVPMLILAVIGATVVLYSVQRRRSLRARPSAEWRRRPLTKENIRQERVQVVLAFSTLVLVVLELFLHQHLHHHI